MLNSPQAAVAVRAPRNAIRYCSGALSLIRSVRSSYISIRWSDRITCPVGSTPLSLDAINLTTRQLLGASGVGTARDGLEASVNHQMHRQKITDRAATVPVTAEQDGCLESLSLRRDDRD